MIRSDPETFAPHKPALVFATAFGFVLGLFPFLLLIDEWRWLPVVAAAAAVGGFVGIRKIESSSTFQPTLGEWALGLWISVGQAADTVRCRTALSSLLHAVPSIDGPIAAEPPLRQPTPARDESIALRAFMCGARELQTKSPMPPATALHALGLSIGAWSGSRELAELIGYVAGALQAEIGSGFQPDVLLRQGYEILRACLREKI